MPVWASSMWRQIGAPVQIKRRFLVEEMFSRALKKLSSYCEGPFHEYARLMQMSAKERKYVGRVIKHKRFLEVGSGYSTLWFSQFVAKIVSVESRQEWFLKLKGLLEQHSIQNVELHLLKPEPCAYDHLGKEKWNNRDNPTGSDYGTA